MKICSKCKIEKSIFVKNRNICKDCKNLLDKKYRDKHKDELSNKKKQYYKENKDIILIRVRKYYEDNKETKLKYNKQYYNDNKEQILKQSKFYYKTNRDKILKYLEQYRKNNYDKIISRKKLYYNNNKQSILLQKKIFNQNNKIKKSESNKSYYILNKSKIRRRKNLYERMRIKNDPYFSLRKSLSKIVYLRLRRNNSSKYNCSCINYLPYTIKELKEHLEKQFEPWMSWENRGNYNPKTWDDNDQSTWTWQLDHIIPQSKLLYMSMSDDNFKKCWALDNLRPLSAKQNILDGCNRIRHI